MFRLHWLQIYVNRNCTDWDAYHITIVLYWLTNLRGLMHTETSTKTHILIIVFNVLPVIMNAEVLSVRLLWCFSETENSCKVCCRNSSRLCTPFNSDGSFIYLRKGKPCTVGFCDGAVSTLLVYVLTMIIYQTELCFLFTSVINAVVLFIPG